MNSRTSAQQPALLMIASFFLASCSTGGGDEETAPHLPEVRGDQLDCEVESYALSAEDWFKENDAFIVGTVRALRPALDPAWAVENGDTPARLLSSSECDSAESGFVVELDTREVIALEGEAPDLSAIHFGYSHFSAWAKSPDISASGISWPKDAGSIAPGMEIALMVRQERSSGRWSPAIARGEQIFGIHEGQLLAQNPSRERCGATPPWEELHETPVSDLLTRLRATKLDSAALDEVQERRSSQQDVSSPENLTIASDWFASCHIQQPADHGDECQESTACDDNEACINGWCVSSD